MYFHFNLFWSNVTYLYQNIKGGIGGIEMKQGRAYRTEKNKAWLKATALSK